MADIETVPCGWLVEVPGGYVSYTDPETGEEYGDFIEDTVKECGAPCVIDDCGWECEAGHSYVNMETRHREGWEYAEDGDEAQALARAGVEPRDFIDGGAFRW